MYYLTPKFHIQAVVPPYTDAGNGLERDALGKVFDRATLSITREECYARGLQLCLTQHQRITAMQRALDMRVENLTATRNKP
jgi:hypothetical protein